MSIEQFEDENVKDLGDRIANLTLMQTSELSTYLLGTYGIELSTKVSTPYLQFDIILNSYLPERKISVIKVIRNLTGIGLKEAKDLVESCPQVVRNNVDEMEAKRIAKELGNAGAEVSLRRV